MLFAVGLVWWLWRLTPERHYLRDMLPGSVLTGFGIGLVQPVMTAVAATSVPPARFATGGAVLNVARQIGTALGIALVVAAGIGAERSGARHSTTSPPAGSPSSGPRCFPRWRRRGSRSQNQA